MGAICYAYECKYSERNMQNDVFVLSVVLWTPLKLQLMAGAERLCHIFEGVASLCYVFEWGREMKKVGNHWSKLIVVFTKIYPDISFYQ